VRLLQGRCALAPGAADVGILSPILLPPSPYFFGQGERVFPVGFEDLVFVGRLDALMRARAKFLD